MTAMPRIQGATAARATAATVSGNGSSVAWQHDGTQTPCAFCKSRIRSRPHDGLPRRGVGDDKAIPAERRQRAVHTAAHAVFWADGESSRSRMRRRWRRPSTAFASRGSPVVATIRIISSPISLWIGCATSWTQRTCDPRACGAAGRAEHSLLWPIRVASSTQPKRAV
jgi:hypothetical protein